VKIGIDISQIAYEETGVANFLSKMVSNLLRIDKKNEYIIFFSSLRKGLNFKSYDLKQNSNVKIKKFIFPPSLLDLFWNKLHILPIEWLIGDVDVFITSDWTEPPTVKAKKVTILYDLIIQKYPNETDKIIIDTQKRKLKWVKKESKMILCISESTKKDAEKILGIETNRLRVIYPGI
jgi:hypothetical protein